MSQAIVRVEDGPHFVDSMRRRVATEAADWLSKLSAPEMLRVITGLDEDTIVLLGQRAERELARTWARSWR